jgi:hypothetical protein
VITGALHRRYPPWFDDWGWLRDPPDAVTDGQLAEVADVDALLDEAPPQVALAARRLVIPWVSFLARLTFVGDVDTEEEVAGPAHS